MDRQKADGVMIPTLKKAKGIVDAWPFSSQDHQKILEIEQDAQEKSLMGLGKVINTGVREVLNCDLIYAALTNMEFDGSRYPSLVLKKGGMVVGEEVRDKEVIERLSNQKNVWFMHKNFVIYKDEISFPQDLRQKICRFETPSLPAEWCVVKDDGFQCNSIIYANPTVPCDLFLKEQYFKELNEQGLGTILVGVKL